MKNIKIIRHAESESNAGGITQDHANIGITESGRSKSEKLADDRNKSIDNIIYSKYIRTKQTAAPFIKKFPNATVIESDLIHEFCDLDESRYNGTRVEDRRVWRKKFYEEDIYYRDGLDGESFEDIDNRIRKFIEYAKSLPDNTVIFSHGKFITILLYILQNPNITKLTNECKMITHRQTKEVGISNLQVIDLGEYI